MVPEPYLCNLDEYTNTTLKMYLFQNVQNVEEIRNNVIQGAWKCAIIKPSLILDPFQVVVAANKAALAAKQNTMVTKTVFAEILYNLSLTKNISQSLNKFGIEEEQNLLVCFLVTEECDYSEHILPQIQGKLAPISQLASLTDLKQVQTTYKLNKIKCQDNWLDVLVARMVTKSFS